VPLLRKPAADLNSDCVVDYPDLGILADNWLMLNPQDPAIDLNSDGAINLKDYALLADTWLDELLWP
jgi:hypothetical protein